VTERGILVTLFVLAITQHHPAIAYLVSSISDPASRVALPSVYHKWNLLLEPLFTIDGSVPELSATLSSRTATLLCTPACLSASVRSKLRLGPMGKESSSERNYNVSGLQWHASKNILHPNLHGESRYCSLDNASPSLRTIIDGDDTLHPSCALATCTHRQPVRKQFKGSQ
jgi:hypothetical protein